MEGCFVADKDLQVDSGRQWCRRIQCFEEFLADDRWDVINVSPPPRNQEHKAVSPFVGGSQNGDQCGRRVL